MKILNEKQFKIIEENVDRFNKKLGINEIDYGDIVYTYFNPGMLLNDWIEVGDDYEKNIVNEINRIVNIINNPTLY